MWLTDPCGVVLVGVLGLGVVSHRGGCSLTGGGDMLGEFSLLDWIFLYLHRGGYDSKIACLLA